MTIAYLGLGANLGDPIEQLIQARRAIAAWPPCSELRCSHFYQSSPVGYAKQSNFVNCVLAVEVRCDALELLDFCQTIETKLGRRRDPSNQNAARLIDIDILLFGEQSINQPRLCVPHPRMQERLFVLKPLLELLPQAQRARYLSSLEQNDFGDQIIHRLVV